MHGVGNWRRAAKHVCISHSEKTKEDQKTDFISKLQQADVGGCVTAGTMIRKSRIHSNHHRSANQINSLE
jgi:hypothetical protein